jgi:uncharacterized membrane protein YoaK (UPF0700 family)
VTRPDRHALLLGASLALLAGYVDALGYLTLKGFFVSFMSGNSTRLSVGLASGDLAAIATASGLILLFVLGVIAGTRTATPAACESDRHPRNVLWLVAALLALAAFAATLGRARCAIGLATLALGAENNVVQKAGSTTIGVTYMTGTLVKMGQALGAAFRGGAAWDWLPYALLWISLVAGAVAGAMFYPALHLQGLWLATAWCACLALCLSFSPAR